jgi:hypothetical protein
MAQYWEFARGKIITIQLEVLTYVEEIQGHLTSKEIIIFQTKSMFLKGQGHFLLNLNSIQWTISCSGTFASCFAPTDQYTARTSHRPGVSTETLRPTLYTANRTTATFGRRLFAHESSWSAKDLDPKPGKCREVLQTCNISVTDNRVSSLANSLQLRITWVR